MKKIIIFLLIISLFSCTAKNESRSIEWINNAKKPIVCIRYGYNEFGSLYTLINNNQRIYQTGMVKLALPDTIKANCDK